MAASPCRIAIVGVGKIARDQHLPALRASPDFELVATVSLQGAIPNVPAFPDLPSLLAEFELDAISVCTPPAQRLEIVLAAVDAGLHVMLEKPPAVQVEAVRAMAEAAAAADTVLFTTWHSREAGAVAPARRWLEGRTIRSVRIDWRENIREWHMGQDWILAADGFGVFDPGINALSIASAILPSPMIVASSILTIPAHREAPLAADLVLECGDAEVTATFDFLHVGEPCWDISVETDDGTIMLRRGGQELEVAGRTETFENTEYSNLYKRFRALIDSGHSDVDTMPLELVLEARRRGSPIGGPPFEW